MEKKKMRMKKQQIPQCRVISRSQLRQLSRYFFVGRMGHVRRQAKRTKLLDPVAIEAKNHQMPNSSPLLRMPIFHPLSPTSRIPNPKPPFFVCPASYRLGTQLGKNRSRIKVHRQGPYATHWGEQHGDRIIVRGCSEWLHFDSSTTQQRPWPIREHMV